MLSLLLLACSMSGKPDSGEDPVAAGDDTAGDTGGDETAGDETAEETAQGDARDPGPGDLVVTEVMKNPDLVEDDLGEWIELRSLADEPLRLEGLRVLDDDGDGFEVGAIVLEVGARVVFGASADTTRNGGVTVDQPYDVELFKLGNDGGAITLMWGDEPLDAVVYDESFPDEKGHALSLSPDLADPDANDAAAAWCAASSAYGLGDFGTPGGANDACAADTGGQDTGDAVVDTDGDGTLDDEDCAPEDATRHPGAPEADNGADDDCDGYVDEGVPTEGALVVTEIMKNPNPTADETGEWFEITNVTGTPIALDGLTVTDSGGTGFTVLTDAILEPAQVYVFGASADASVNGGYTPDYVYAVSDLQLGNGDDEVILAFGGALIDEVAYDEDFPDDSGKSLSLDPTGYEAEANDDKDAWCNGDGEYGTDGNQGTPGSANDPCD